ncbi:glycoside hydrolase family 43 protein [Baudoinia panamericana UAMH 10762]|uniref:Glycoside hydrolase family 43 protein n=1 Tax=Baudoinia panamericana (strain UAMH 10762) TaxID=717646 RepID=M2LR12_BAUPA|nr:glycoside hydrolase family 43 protein [Baudoinia panamericana UAMH 10762]EMC96872.1 glycoside hydrolase family 43 protein [Baudoinia panamericana UAMH 10762]
MQTYNNPIISGFAPDPSVVLVDGTYFLVTSSFHIFPGIPIYASKDLQTWVQIGNAINRPEQVDLTNTITKAVKLHGGETMIGAGGLFAPTIRYDRGTFYIVCTNVSEEGDDFAAENFYISTTNIWKGDWSDPKPLNFKGIDPSLFIDDDGRAYIQGAWRLDRTEQPYSTIKQYEIDLHTGQQLSEPKELWQGSAQVYTEGPHLYKKDGYYYLLVAEGGTFEDHMISIARSKDILGPYENCQENPILTAAGKPDELVQDTGHGELFQDSEGQWWATVLGVRKVDDRYPLGRESFLVPVDWPEGGWPRMPHPQLQFQRQACGSRAKWACLPQKLHVDDCHIRTPSMNLYRRQSTSVSLRPTDATLAVPVGSASFVGKRQRSINDKATVSLVLAEANLGKPVVAGLAVYKDDYRSASIAVDFGKGTIILRQRRTKDAAQPPEEVDVNQTVLSDHPGDKIQLGIDSCQTHYTFQYREDPSSPWTVLGSVDTLDLTCRDFTGTILGVFAHNTTLQNFEGDWVTFSHLTVTGQDQSQVLKL